MAEYIEKKTAIKILRGEAVARYPSSFYYGLYAAADEVKQIPAADVAEVVRCKDCKHWSRDGNGYGDDESHCTNPDGLDNYAKADDFCSYGERRADDATEGY
jgi:hypothetical protein